MYQAQSRIGPYVLVQKLGQGGFAPVWLAKEMYGETELRSAAVKLFSLDRLPGSSRRSTPQDAASVAAFRARVIEEARVLCRVEHPNIVRFYSMLSDEAHDVIGLAMEYLAGESVDHVLSRRGTLPLVETLEIGIAVASALAEIHANGLVHRDVKPANVVDAARVYKLIDFGIAASMRRAGEGTPRTVVLDDLPLALAGTQMSEVPDTYLNGADDSHLPAGTFGYMDPETVATGAPPAPASDLYSLGAMLFECATGKVPAVRGAGEGLSGEILDGRKAAPPLRSIAAQMPPGFAALVDKLLAPTRADRPKSATWVARELERLRSEATYTSRSLPDEDLGPFRALERFERGDRDVYFGRTVEVAGALEMLRSRGFVAIVGPSGSGKSSLARAGVIPAVADGGLGHWPSSWDIFVTSPGVDPKSALATALAPVVADAAKLTPEQVVFSLGERVQLTGTGVFLVLDQLEELATLAAGRSRDWAVELLVRLGEQTVPGVRTLATARQDLLDPLLRIHDLGRTLGRGSLLVVTPFTDAGWMDVVDQALQTYGYELEDQVLRDELCAQLRGTANAMPLVQFALTQLWAQRDRAGKRITRQGLRSIGGIAGALERHAEGTMDTLLQSSSHALDVAQQVLLALTTTHGTRATRSIDEIVAMVPSPLTRAVLERLESARLFVREPEGITLAHEALLTHWRRLQVWVAGARQARELEEDLERDADRWSTEPELIPLLPRRRTLDLDGMCRRGEIRPSERALAYLKASRRAANKSRVLVGGAVIAFASALAIGGALYVANAATRRDLVREHYRAEQEQRRAEQAEGQLTQLAALKSKMDGLEGRFATIDDRLRNHDLDGATQELNAAKDDASEIKKGLGQLAADITSAHRAAAAIASGATPTIGSSALPAGSAASSRGDPAPSADPNRPITTMLAHSASDPVAAPHNAAPTPPAPDAKAIFDGSLYSIADSCLVFAYQKAHQPIRGWVNVTYSAAGEVQQVTVSGVEDAEAESCIRGLVPRIRLPASSIGSFAMKGQMSYPH